ncbi:MAG TPA: phosphoribosylformylglycinamidine synthase I [Desulfotomaculum sp.]|jgi:phosphoribosylformylglycinamidine synthase|nr:phosphoribosylformylglycinamidine synthase I [Desulfotomaculum sp.]
MKPKVCILRTDGTNCDQETFYAFEKVGGESNLVHINSLRSREEKLADYHILAIPGGFSYGDDVHSGKILAVELTSFLKEQMQEFVDAGKPALGICNGFQVLVRTGLLPGGQTTDRISAALIHNDSGRFECRWVNLLVEKTRCVFVQGLEGKLISLQVAHGEGRFYTSPDTLKSIEDGGHVVVRYADSKGESARDYPLNPNGSLNAIAGICDPTGRIFGLMPHPERFVEDAQNPNWRRGGQGEPHGLAVFRNAVRYAREM